MEDVDALRAGCLVARMRKWRGQISWNGCWIIVFQELDALLKEKSIFLGLIASLERDAECNKKEVEMEWPDLSLFLKIR